MAKNSVSSIERSTQLSLAYVGLSEKEEEEEKGSFLLLGAFSGPTLPSHSSVRRNLPIPYRMCAYTVRILLPKVGIQIVKIDGWISVCPYSHSTHMV